MTLTQRFQLVTRALTGALTGVLPNTTGFNMLNGIYPGGSSPLPLAGTKERLDAFANTPWLHAVADKVATAFAAVRWQLFVVRRSGQGPALRAKAMQKSSWEQRAKLFARAKAAGDLVEIEEHVLLDALDAANPYQTGPAMRKVWMLHYDLAGDAFLLKERNGLGAPIAYWPIPPHWVLRTPTPSQRSYRVGFAGWHGEIPDTEFLWISNPNPVNPYGRGVGMAQALADEIETDEYAAKMTRQTFLNGARPDYLVFPKEGENRPGWSPESTSRLEEQWRNEHQGFWRVAKPKFLQREVGVYEFEQNKFRDLQLVQLREFERDAIRIAYGVPPEIMGILGPGSNRATITQAANIFARNVLIPRLEVFRSALQEYLVPEYDERLIVQYESPAMEDQELTLEYARVAPWALMIDEHRAKQNLPELDGGAGRVFLVPFNLQAQENFSQDAAPIPVAQRALAKMTTEELLRLRGGEPAPPAPPSYVDVHVASPVVNVSHAAGAMKRDYFRDDEGAIVGHYDYPVEAGESS